MKNLTILIFALLFTQLTAFSQPCLPEGIGFISQEEIDNFQTNYPGCTEIGGNVVIGSWSTDITNLTGLSVLTSIDGDLRIGFDMGTIPVGTELTNLSGLENLTFLGGSLGFQYNDQLISLSSLSNLTSIGGDLYIIGADALVDLTGLENLTYIGGTLLIGAYYEVNPALNSITSLENIDAGSIENLYIVNNPSLSTCAVQSICDYLASPNGTVEIHDNAEGCSSQEEVEDACIGVSIEELINKNSFTISPNPLKSSTIMCYTLHQNSLVSLKILDLSGQLVVTLVNEFQQQGKQKIEFNSTGLPAGVYFCTLFTNHGIQTTKLIKQ